MNDEIEKIIPAPIPFDVNDKIYQQLDEETGEHIGELYSYNDWLENIKNISGINEELLGPNK